jgi:hypothetical protein
MTIPTTEVSTMRYAPVLNGPYTGPAGFDRLTAEVRP